MARLTDEQRLARKDYLGASDLAVLAGVSPWQSPFELYLEKVGELDPAATRTEEDLDRMERGHRLEDVALDWHADLTGIRIARIRRDVRHPRIPFIVVHPDAQVVGAKPKHLIEAKTASRPPDGLPQHWEAQVQAQMAATGAEAVTIVVLTFNGPPTAIEVVRNDELIAGLEDLAGIFWARVQAKEPPPLDGSHGARRWLDRLFREGPEQRADATQAEAIARLLAIRAEVKTLKAEDDTLVNALGFSMAGGSKLYAPGVGRVNWTAPTSRHDVRWKEVAADYRALAERYAPDPFAILAELEAIEIAQTTVTENARQFRVTAAKEDD